MKKLFIALITLGGVAICGLTLLTVIAGSYLWVNQAFCQLTESDLDQAALVAVTNGKAEVDIAYCPNSLVIELADARQGGREVKLSFVQYSRLTGKPVHYQEGWIELEGLYERLEAKGFYVY